MFDTITAINSDNQTKHINILSSKDYSKWHTSRHWALQGKR